MTVPLPSSPAMYPSTRGVSPGHQTLMDVGMGPGASVTPGLGTLTSWGAYLGTMDPSAGLDAMSSCGRGSQPPQSQHLKGI
jgi:hypothetical protein